MITRNFEIQLIESLKYFPCVALTGARQTGKTTLLRNILSDYNYVCLDLPSIAQMAEENSDAFFEKYKTPLIIDEVQYAPKLFRYLKEKIDKNRHLMGQIVLTGSQKFELMKDLSESLAGRVAILELEGLNWKEYKNAPCFNNDSSDSDKNQEKTATFNEFIVRGGFPELTRVPDFPLDMYFSSYLATYLERDVRQLVNVSNLRTFEQFIRFLAIRNAQQLDMSEIANSLGISVKTVSSWLSVLETSAQITVLEPWFVNFGKRLVKTPKIYFNDTGLLCWLLGVNKDNLSISPFLGSIFETAVFAELRKQNKLNSNNKKIYYYRDSNQTEVDFMVMGDGCKMIEVKLTTNPKSDDAAGLKKFANMIYSLKTIPSELNQISFEIICNTPCDYPLKVKLQDEKEIVVNVMNVMEICK